MKNIEILIDGTKASIEVESRIITILQYGKGLSEPCDMTICYAENWAPQRAIQHAITIIQAINQRIIV